MQIIEYDSEDELRRYIRNNFVKALGSGREGACFLMPDGYVIKTIDTTNYYIEWLEKFDGIKVPGFSFALGGILVNSYVKAIFLDYINGLNINKVKFETYNVEILKKALINVKNNIVEISDKGIRIVDAFFCNIMFDGSKFTFVDTQCYEFSYYSNLVGINIVSAMSEIYKYMFTNNPYVHEFLMQSIYKDYLYDYELLFNPDIILSGIEDIYIKETDKEIETFEDLKLVLK